ncbi:14-3-3 domain-containing protein [Mycena leptocephala]|nr:14-3-3 domain-containing protein [Mycena leptocephala]
MLSRSESVWMPWIPLPLRNLNQVAVRQHPRDCRRNRTERDALIARKHEQAEERRKQAAEEIEWGILRAKIDALIPIRRPGNSSISGAIFLRMIIGSVRNIRFHYLSFMNRPVLRGVRTVTRLTQGPEAHEDSVYLAKLAEKAGAMKLSPVLEMVEIMRRVASSNQEITVEERNLLSVAYKNKDEFRNDGEVAMAKSYRKKIEQELAEICGDVFEVLEKYLIPAAPSGESKVFYHKM